MIICIKQVHDKKLGYIKLSRVEKFILLIGAYEEKIFKKRSDIRDCKLRGFCNNDDTVSALFQNFMFLYCITVDRFVFV